MSDSVTPTEFRTRIREFASVAMYVREKSPPGRAPFKVVVFLDELNTCRNVCLTAEVLSGGTLDGEPLPDNIFFVAAVNPLRTPADAGVAPAAGAGAGAAPQRNPNTGLAEDAMDKQEYIVYGLPPTVQSLVRDVGEFGNVERGDFINAFVTDANLAMSKSLQDTLGDASADLMPLAARMIDVAHTFVQDADMHRVKVSQGCSRGCSTFVSTRWRGFLVFDGRGCPHSVSTPNIAFIWAGGVFGGGGVVN